MKLDIFILGCLAEKPLSLNEVISLADMIKTSRWMDSSKESIFERLDILKNLGYISSIDAHCDSTEEKKFKSTAFGVDHYQNKIKNYLFEKEINLGMLILALTFSNHFPKDEFISIVKRRIAVLQDSAKATESLSSKQYLSKFYNLCLSSSSLLKRSEIASLETFLSYAQSNSTWEDYINNIVH